MGSLNLPQMTAGQGGKHITSNDGDEALDKAITEAEVLDFTSGNITLTDAQLRENFLFECDNVAAARDLVLPTTAIKRFFAVNVQSDETFDVTVKKGTTAIVVTAGDNTTFYTNGTTNDLRKVGGGGGAVVFTDLTDTPSSYSSQALKLCRVNTGETALEFVTPGASGGGAPFTFSGLFLKTAENVIHADSDDTIELIRLKSASFDDGASVKDLANLVCDLTTTGAGALDTGTIAASKWYSLFLIQRSDTEVNALIATLANDIVVDQSSTTNNADFKLRATSAEEKGAQSFKPSVTSKTSHIDLKLGETGVVPVGGSIWITIEADSSGDPSGTPLMTSQKMNAAGIGTTDREIRFVFHNPTSLAAATTFWIVLQGDYTVSATNHITWRGNTTTVYADGLAKDFDGATWATPTDGNIVDFVFAYYPERTGDTITMPLNFDRQVKLGYFRTDVSADVRPYQQIDKRCFWGLRLAKTPPAAAGIVLLLDLLDLLPPTLCIARLDMSNSNGTAIRTTLAGVPEGYSASTALTDHVDHYSQQIIPQGLANFINSPHEIITQTGAIYEGQGNVSTAKTLVVHGYEWMD